ncbi:putative ribonuclease H protein [Sesamum angolense]|uniref:Ribonuclease H protein n=1 Tax=Sesamum angolense TaxID=2727404 RepID=A0AAE1TA21_9LAMI|nr:putative ribonuclease H protein [Sesamum angolense]
MSEVCGASADIHLAMNEFRDCILGTGLIHLPVQGELFSWHNCSEGDRSLWNVWIDCWLMMLGYDCGRIRIINVLTLGLPITPHLCSEEILITYGDKLEQVMLQQRAKIQWLKGGDQCSRIFFRKVAMRRASKRVFQIINEDGHTLTTQEDVVNEFVSSISDCSGEESQALVQSVTREEIKDAFFDIAEDKAPGPDGYSSGFYKAAWPVIGEEMIKAITGKRSCSGYNRQGLPMRCALKVDLRKAYDTVEWDFLSAVLQMFGFSGTFIGWVEECVTTPMFSVCINGNPHGFFKGSRGLRQGDPMSPFLFVLIMEVLQLMLLQLIDQNEGFSFHWGARSLDYSNFALQMTSSSSVKLMWLRFGFLDTGWTSSPNCPGYMPIHKRVSLFSPVQHRMSGNNYLQHYISRRVTFPQLSFAGRLQLIKSVLMSLNVYWAMAFILPKGVIREVEKKMRTFLWKGNSAVGYPKVAWSVVCKPIEEGGQGIRDILALNKALMSRHLWNVIQNNQSSIWVKWIAHTRLRHKSVWTVDVKGGSWGWRKILRLRSALLPYIEFKIGDGNRSLFGMTRGIASAP